jgi:hypothetical protein
MMDLLMSLSSQVPPSVASAMQVVLLAYLGMEVVFYFVFHYHLVPRANQRTVPSPYRDYGGPGERHKLLFRMLERVKQGAMAQSSSNDVLFVRQALADCLIGWFEQVPRGGRTKVQLSARAKARLLERNKAKWLSSSSLSSSGDSFLDEPVPQATLLRGLSTATGCSDASNADSDQNSSRSTNIVSEPEDEGRTEALVVEKGGKWMMEGLWEENAGVFFAWALFGKDVDDLEEWEEDELLLCETKAEQEHDLIFPQSLHNIPSNVQVVKGPTASPRPPPPETRNKDDDAGRQQRRQQQPILDPRLLTLEDLSPMHRPLAVYLAVMVMKMIGGAFLRCLGFHRLVIKNMVIWYRPASSDDRAAQAGQEELLQPLLFFHGIAPGGHVLYLPMLLGGIVRGERPRAVAIFENPSISTTLGFNNAISEYETVAAIQEFIETCLDKNEKRAEKQKLAIVGHSFGSCPVTWLVHSSLQERIGQILLLDPVTILLHQPAVMSNFLYSNDVFYIRIAAASELFTEHYLRRHFSWYNSELWLEDLPANVPVTICLSGGDAIVDAPTVHTHVLRHKQENKCDNMNVIYWENVPHASCVIFPFKWRQIRKAMLQQELRSVQQQRH